MINNEAETTHYDRSCRIEIFFELLMKSLHFSRLHHFVHDIVGILGSFLCAPAFTFNDFMASGMTVIREPVVDIVLERVFPM